MRDNLISINQIHLEEVDSTQEYLRTYCINNEISEHILVTASKQTNGKGRGVNQWDHFEHSIACSFILSPNAIQTLTPIEVGVSIAEFFKSQKNIELKLKWPNDLLDSNHLKVGGIIASVHNKDYIVIGVGININSPDLSLKSEYKTKANSITLNDPIHAKDLALEMYNWILNNRNTRDSIQKKFKDHCCHLNQPVSIGEFEGENNGIFIGIGEFGEAIVSIDGEEKSFFSAHLWPKT